MAQPCACKLFKMLPLVELLNISNFSLKWECVLQLSHFRGFNSSLLGAVLIAFVGLEGHLSSLNMLLICITKESCAAMNKKELQ